MQNAALARYLRLFLRGWSLTFAAVGAIFVLAPNGTIRVINAVGAWFGDFPPAPESELRFWLSLGFAYMVLVTVLAWVASNDPYRRRDLLLILAAGKAASSLSCLAFYLWTEPCFIYLLNFLVDGSIVLQMVPAWAVAGLLGPPSGSGGSPIPGHDTRERRVMRIALGHLYPAGGRAGLSAADVHLEESLWNYAATQGPAVVAAFRALAWILEWGTIFFARTLTPFTGLPDRDAARYLAGWLDSPWYARRLVLFQLRFIADMHYFADPRVKAALGYVDPPLPAETGPLAEGTRDFAPSVWSWKAAARTAKQAPRKTEPKKTSPKTTSPKTTRPLIARPAKGGAR